MNSVCYKPSVSLALLAAASAILFVAGVSGCEAHETLTIALDRSVYKQRELDQLVDLVRDAAKSGMEIADIGLKSGAADVLIRDMTANPHLADAVMQAAKKDGADVETTPATSFWIDYSPAARNAFDAAHLQNDASLLEEMIHRLRTPLLGVSITQDADGAIVRADDPSFESVLSNALGRTFTITPLGKTSWRVLWIDTALATVWTPAKRLDAKLRTAETLRQLLGDPLGLEVYETSQGAYFAVLDPDRHKPFIEAVKRAFRNNPDLILREAPAVDIRISTGSEKSPSEKETTPVAPPLIPEHLKLVDDVENVVDPPVDIRIEGNAVLVKAKMEAQRDDLSAIVHGALKDRNDISIALNPDGSQRVEIAPGHRLGSPVPQPRHEQLLQAVESRLNDAKIHPLKISAPDDAHVRVTFKSAAEVSAFRSALSNLSGLVMRLVEQSPPGPAPAKPPSLGDERLKLPSGEEIWVKPQPIITGDMVADAVVGQNKYTNEPVVQFHLTDEGAARFAVVTRLHVGERFAVMVDGKVLAAPFIREPIVGGEGKISGEFTEESAKATVASIMARRADLPLAITGETDK